MLLVNQRKVQLKQTYAKILYLYPAYNQTFVFLGMLGLRRDCVVHVDKQGKVLFQYEFAKPMDAFGTMNDHQCIMLQTRAKPYISEKDSEQYGSCITILNLKTYQFKRTPHFFRNQQSDQNHIVCFSNTKYLCIQQDGRYNDNLLKLSYYHYPLDTKDKPFNVFTSIDNQWTYEHIVNQGNQHSMICWYKSRQDNEWEWKTYDLRDDLNGKFMNYRFNQETGLPYNMNTVQIAIDKMWQMSRGKFLFICISNKPQTAINKDLGVVQNNYVCDIQTKLIRQAKFSLGQYQDQIIDYINLGSIFMIRTFDFYEGETLQTPIFYISNQTEEIVDQEKWKCSYLFKDQPTGADTDTLISNQYENGDVDWFVCSSRKVAKPQEITVHWLLELNPNFQEELLSDVVDMIDYKK